MIKNRIIQMENGRNYYVLEEVEYNNKKYVLSVECDLDKDYIEEDDYLIMEVALSGNDIVIKNVNSEKVAKIVSSILLEKIQKDK